MLFHFLCVICLIGGQQRAGIPQITNAVISFRATSMHIVVYFHIHVNKYPSTPTQATSASVLVLVLDVYLFYLKKTPLQECYILFAST